jgi:hypothetical protein
MGRWRRSRAGAAGVLVGTTIAVVVVLSWPSEPDVVEGPEAATAFVEAYERSRLVDVYVGSEFRRELPTGQMEGVHELAQRPPDVVRRQLGAFQGHIGGRSIVCDPDPQDTVVCLPGAPVTQSYDEQVAEEIDRWTNYFIGDTPYYRVTEAGDGCFDLSMFQYLAASPLGVSARFCFDDETGALVYREVRHEDEMVEVSTAVEVRAVTDADFVLPG